MTELDIAALLACMITSVVESEASSVSNDNVVNAMDSILSAVVSVELHPDASLDSLYAMASVLGAAGRKQAPNSDSADEMSPSDSAETQEMARLLRSSVQLHHQVRLKRQMTISYQATTSPLEPCLEDPQEARWDASGADVFARKNVLGHDFAPLRRAYAKQRQLSDAAIYKLLRVQVRLEIANREVRRIAKLNEKPRDEEEDWTDEQYGDENQVETPVFE
ncbi:hypothetical protein LEN26_000251 [Aphanomyces euteiches]|nr:hypothetical protein AeMF1_001397 [Aphanomyces euteiches]KAH9163959.1 hypothetical protein LEN26_000251 [Aphanomyces euteiches]KAH9195119.1 hypothetical protein AeNC1_002902 [Aphanomyces euteiches]